ncbi:MAG: flotillin-like protein FloA [Planctomycetes bacterium]|nr:flotillin-like protein FloA [Planctomycetota bacterium]
MPPIISFLLVAAAVVFSFVFLLFFLKFGWLYLRAFSSGVHVDMLSLLGMWIRGVNPALVVDSRIMAYKAGLNVSYSNLDQHFLAQGNIKSVVKAMVMASKAKIDLEWDRACAIDLAGRDVFEAVRTSTNPKVIDVPDQTKGTAFISAIANDGIQLKVRARVTVRTNLDQLIGGAVEETIIARVGEGIVSTVGSSKSHKEMLEHPDSISRTVLEKSLDSGTAFEILSIDIADVDVGENIGAKLQTAQAEADKVIAQAKAEERRVMAVSLEQEMKARVMENRAKVVDNEAQVPLAMAEAFRKGHMGVMDYYNMKNIQSDTDMRESISKDDK